MTDQTTRPTILIAGGAGFLGSHLCADYLATHKVVCVDNLSTGRKENIKTLLNNNEFFFVEADIVSKLPEDVTKHRYDIVANLASPASPPGYQKLSLETLAVGSEGTWHLLELARRDNARFFHASTSEVYGDPTVHPQTESYWGNVNSYGPRSMYDEAKRYAEALIYSYRQRHNLSTGIVRIFNTYGPNMDPLDGRVVSNFIVQAINNQPLTIYGDGSQTRSFCYVSDLIAGFVKMIESDEEGPINLGNPGEFTMKELADKIIAQTGHTAGTIQKPMPGDDPKQRCPDIALAKQKLNWEPTIDLEEGLLKTIDYFKSVNP
jgi:nucleoside-diphosphate-sugar epimerase